MKDIIFRSVIIISVFYCGTSYAYIGPGAGLSALGSVAALIGGVLLLIIGFLWYPLKRLLKKKEPTDAVTSEDDSKK